MTIHYLPTFFIPKCTQIAIFGIKISGNPGFRCKMRLGVTWLSCTALRGRNFSKGQKTVCADGRADLLEKHETERRTGVARTDLLVKLKPILLVGTFVKHGLTCKTQNVFASKTTERIYTYSSRQTYAWNSKRVYRLSLTNKNGASRNFDRKLKIDSNAVWLIFPPTYVGLRTKRVGGDQDT
jgi:hypothetical protein